VDVAVAGVPGDHAVEAELDDEVRAVRHHRGHLEQRHGDVTDGVRASRPQRTGGEEQVVP
jgi:hypothetical protein